MIPTSIDGTDITGATIDGTDVTEITVDGDTVFTAAEVVDDFDSNNLTTKWNTNGLAGTFTGYNSVTSPVESGSHALEITQSSNGCIYLDASANQPTPTLGDTHEFYLNTDSNANFFVCWLSDKTLSGSDVPTGHFVRINQNSNSIELGHSIPGSFGTARSISTLTLPNGYNRFEISYINSNSTLQLKIFDVSNNQIFSDTVNITSNGVGTSCAIHSRDPTTSFLDTWTIK